MLVKALCPSVSPGGFLPDLAKTALVRMDSDFLSGSGFPPKKTVSRVGTLQVLYAGAIGACVSRMDWAFPIVAFRLHECINEKDPYFRIFDVIPFTTFMPSPSFMFTGIQYVESLGSTPRTLRHL